MTDKDAVKLESLLKQYRYDYKDDGVDDDTTINDVLNDLETSLTEDIRALHS